MSFAGAVRWTLSGKSFTSMVSVGAPGMANSTTSLFLASSAYATVLGATLIRFSSIVATSLVVSCSQPGVVQITGRSAEKQLWLVNHYELVDVAGQVQPTFR